MCDDNKDPLQWKFLFRQILVNSGVWSSYFLFGFSLGTPTVLVPQLRKEANSTEAVTIDEATWLPAMIYYSALPWVVIFTVISEFAGRKIAFFIMGISAMIGFIIFYCSGDVHQILISEAFQGVTAAANITMAAIICTEYTSTKFRGIFLTISSATFFWGVLVANAMGTFFHWKNIPLVGIACSGYCLIIVYFWSESPLWLSKKGKIDRCKQAHRWLKGSSVHAEKELSKLIENDHQIKKKLCWKREATDWIKVLNKKEFYKPVLLSFLLLALYTLCGKHISALFAIDILMKITKDSSTAYTSMLMIDAVTVASMYVGCGISKLFRRRTLLLTFTVISELFLFSLSTYLYLVKLLILNENVYLSLSLFIGFSISVSCGPMILSISITGELMPVESRSTATCITALTIKTIYGTYIKLFPTIFQKFGMDGTFFFFGISSTICLILLYIYLPETKDKSLEEIADSMIGKSKSNNIAEVKTLLSDKNKNINNSIS